MGEDWRGLERMGLGAAFYRGGEKGSGQVAVAACPLEMVCVSYQPSLSRRMFITSMADFMTEVPGPKMAATPAR